ncbi:hypothetical protein V6N12_063090 [Hibiscus sabdariffa]|uniref:Uncharacterized protein n=1 Tax=Hibiscus sabdariffa TaxID=183260 RepID=A0ABR2FAQ3_9ROSI
MKQNETVQRGVGGCCETDENDYCGRDNIDEAFSLFFEMRKAFVFSLLRALNLIGQEAYLVKIQNTTTQSLPHQIGPTKL